MFLNCGGTAEYLEGTYADAGRTCKDIPAVRQQYLPQHQFDLCFLFSGDFSSWLLKPKRDFNQMLLKFSQLISRSTQQRPNVTPHSHSTLTLQVAVHELGKKTQRRCNTQISKQITLHTLGQPRLIKHIVFLSFSKIVNKGAPMSKFEKFINEKQKEEK